MSRIFSLHLLKKSNSLKINLYFSSNTLKRIIHFSNGKYKVWTRRIKEINDSMTLKNVGESFTEALENTGLDAVFDTI